MSTPAAGIRQFVVGTGGRSHYRFSEGATHPNTETGDDDTFGVLKLTLHPDAYSWEFLPEAGKTYTRLGRLRTATDAPNRYSAVSPSDATFISSRKTRPALPPGGPGLLIDARGMPGARARTGSEVAPSPAMAGRWGRDRAPTGRHGVDRDRLPGARDHRPVPRVPRTHPLGYATRRSACRPLTTGPSGNGRNAGPCYTPRTRAGRDRCDRERTVPPMTAGPTRARTPTAAQQLALDLPVSLPAIAIEPEWKAQQRLWGHSFHPMCSYLASFPAALAHAFIARYSRPGDVVLDPFSGRGTTPLQACAEGRIGVGNDLNPFAHLLTASKVEPATRRRGDDPADAAAPRLESPTPSRGRHWPARRGRSDRDARAGRRLRHGATCRVRARAGRGRARVPPGHPRPAAVRPDQPPPRRPHRPVPCRGHHRDPPRQERELPVGAHAQHVQHGAALRPRLRRPHRVRLAATRRVRRPRPEARPPVPPAGPADGGRSPCSATPATSRGRARAALRARGRPDRARLVVTSPPYLRVVKYGYYNWLRTWFLGFDAKAIDATLDDAHHREPYLAFLRDVLADLRAVLTDDAVVVLVIGDVETDRGRRIRGGIGLAERAWEQAAEPEGYRLAGVALDDVAAVRKMTKLWGDEAGRATKTDRILVLGATEAGRRRALVRRDPRRRLDLAAEVAARPSDAAHP